MRSTCTRGLPQGRMLSCCQMPQPASDDLANGAPMSPEVELIRALSEDLALEILASYAPEDFADADFTSLGKAAVYLADHGSAPGPALEELITKVQNATKDRHVGRD